MYTDPMPPENDPCQFQIAMLQQRIVELERQVAALQADNERLRFVADFTYDWTYWMDPAGDLVYISPACQRITGYSAAEFQADPGLIEYIIHPDDQAWMAYHLRDEQRRQQAYELQFRIITRSGEQRWIGHACQPVVNAAGDWLGQRTSNRDITAQKQAEEAYCLLVDNSLIGFLIAQDGRNVFVNATAAQVTGYSVAELLAMSPAEAAAAIHPDDRSMVVQRGLERQEGQAVPQQYCFRILRKDGRVRWLEAFSAQSFYQGRSAAQMCYIDITARKQDEAALRVQHQLSTTLSAINNLSQGLAMVLETVLQLEGIDCGGIYLVNEQNGSLDLAAHSGLSERFIDSSAYIVSNSPQADLVRAGTPVYQLYAAFDFVPPERRMEGLRAVAILPIMHQQQVIAVLNLGSRSVDELPEPTRTLLEAIATQIGAAIVRITTETALHESQRNLQSLFNTLEDLLFIACHDGRLIHANPAVEQRLGYTRAELLTKYVLDMHPPERHAETMAVFQAMVEGRKTICPVPLITKTGQFIPVETRIVAGVWDGQEVIFGISRDISERVQMEEALRESQLLLQAVINNAPVAILAKDRQGRYLLANRQAAANLQLSVEQMIGVSGGDLLDSSFVETVSQSDQQVWETGQPVELEETVILPVDGELHTLLTVKFPLYNVHGEMYAVGAVVTDITERKRIEESLRKLACAIEQSSTSVLITDASGAIEYVNPYFTQVTGYTLAEVIGQNPRLLKSGFVAPAVYAELWQSISNGTGWNGELYNRKKNGDLYWEYASIAPIFDEAGVITHYVAVKEDITARKHTEAALLRSEARFRGIVEQSSDGIALIDEQGLVIEWNPAQERITGLSRTAVLGRPAWDVLHDLLPTPERTPAIYKRNRDRIIAALQDGEASWFHRLTEMYFQHPDGRLWYAQQQSFPIKINGGFHICSIMRNMTARKQMEEELRESEERYRSVLTAIHEGVVLQDSDGVIVACNASAERILGLTHDEVIGRTSADQRWQAIREDGAPFPGDMHPAMVTLRTGEARSNVVMGLPRAGGKLTWISINCQPLIRPGSTRPYAVVTSFSDITERKQMIGELQQANARLQQQAIRDALTGLYNRRYLDERLPHEVQRAERQKQPLSVIMLDIDYFKRFNDTYGHDGGDALLRAVGEFLQASIRGEDIVCRYGGEEFMLVLPGAILEHARQRAEQIRLDIQSLVVLHHGQALDSVTISLGVAAFPEHGTTADMLMQAADRALYQAKRTGRDHVVVAVVPVPYISYGHHFNE